MKRSYAYLQFISCQFIKKLSSVIQEGINYKTVFENMPGLHALISADKAPVTLAITNAYAIAAGQPKEQLTGKSFLKLFLFTDAALQKAWETGMQASVQEAMAQKKAHHFSIPTFPFAKAGSKNYTAVTVNNQPIADEKGDVQFILHSIVEAGAAYNNAIDEPGNSPTVSSSYELLRQAPVAICIVKGTDYTVELANEGMLQFLGRTAEMIGKPIIESLPEAKLQGLIGILDRVRTTGEPYRIDNFAATILIDGQREERFFNLVFKPVLEAGTDTVPSRIFCVAHNITSQKRDQQRIAESEEKYRTLFTGMDQGFCILEMIFDADNNPVDYKFLEINPVFEKQTGLVDAVGKTARQLVPNLEPHWYQLYGQVALTGESIHFLEGSEAMGRWFEVNAFRLGGTDSRRVALLFTDITQRKKTEAELEEKVKERTIELENLYHELKRSNINLQEFAYAASHDLKEPIRKIHFFSDRLKGELEEQLSANQLRLFNRLELASKRMATLIDDLLAYSQTARGRAEQEKIDLNVKLRHVLEDLELEIEEKAAIIKVDPLPTVRGNRRQFQQLFQNLISNALKYAQPGTVPEIRLTAETIRGHQAQYPLPAEMESKTFYQIKVHDNGIGFDPQDAERIFNVFTRLHGNAEYRGTGVGLSIARKVAENHEGYIWAQSKPGKGATFTILLPVE